MSPFVAPHQIAIDAPNVAHVLYDNAAAVVVLPRQKSDSVDFRTNRLHGVVTEHLLDHRNARRVVILRRWDRSHACLALSPSLGTVRMFGHPSITAARMHPEALRVRDRSKSRLRDSWIRFCGFSAAPQVRTGPKVIQRVAGGRGGGILAYAGLGYRGTSERLSKKVGTVPGTFFGDWPQSFRSGR